MKLSRSIRWYGGATLLAAATLCLGDAPLAASSTPAPAPTLGGPQTGTGTTDVTRSAMPPPPPPLRPPPPPPASGGS